jgi:DNA-binding transcriptional ArsR family regulator
MRNKKLAQNSFTALGDPTRLKIYLKIIELAATASLADKPIIASNTASQLNTIFDLAKSTISHHIEQLLAAELIFIVCKNRHNYLFPNFVKIQEFSTFLDTEVLTYFHNGQMQLCGQIYLAAPIDNILTFCDFLKINSYRNIECTKDQLGNHKVYFKITGFNEAFYFILNDKVASIYCLAKNYSQSEQQIKTLILLINSQYASHGQNI